MTGQQFVQHDEATAHAAMLARIRTEQLANEPEPDHEPSTLIIDDPTYAEPTRTITNWCCYWHEHHAEA